MTFLQKLYSEYTKIEKPILVITSYEGLDDDEELKMIPIVNNNNNIDVVSDFDSDDKIKNEFLKSK